MFARAASIFVFALPLLATATVLPRNDGSSQCNSGSTVCCGSNVAPTDQSIQWLLDIIGVSAGSLIGTVGLDCVADFTQCVNQATCCENDYFSGLISLNCDEINV